jgi:hypothetical protein
MSMVGFHRAPSIADSSDMVRDLLWRRMSTFAAKSNADAWKKLQAIADGASPQLQKKILKAIKATKAGVNLPALEGKLSAKDLQAAIDAVPWDELEKLKGTLPPVFDKILTSAAKTAVSYLPKGVNISFNQLNPASIEWIKSHTADLVTNISNANKLVIKDIIKNGFEQGVTPAGMARDIRASVGLLARDQSALSKYQAGLVEKGRSAADIQRLVARKEKQMINRRANLIAHHESMIALNRGQTALWELGVKNGEIDDTRYEREFVVTQDDLLCPICAPLDGARFPIMSPGPDPIFDGPPIHVQCRCTISLTKSESGKIKVIPVSTITDKVLPELDLKAEYPLAAKGELPKARGAQWTSLNSQKTRQALLRMAREDGSDIDGLIDRKALDEMLRIAQDPRLVLQEDRIAYFGIEGSKFRQLKVGEEFVALGARSTTTDAARAALYAHGENGVVFKTTLPRGTTIVDVEILGIPEGTMLPGSRFSSISALGENNIMEMQLISDGKAYIEDLGAFRNQIDALVKEWKLKNGQIVP